MSARRVLALWTVGWVVVAAAGATLAWAVISRAGDGVSGGLDSLSTAAASGSAGDPAAGVTITRSPSSSPSSPTSSPSGVSSTGEGSADPTQDLAVVARTWEGTAGLVSAECRGLAVSLTGATPHSGYAVEVDDTGPDRVRVEFETDETRIRVEAECVGGAPVFTDEQSGEG